MHGRLKVRTTKEENARKQIERALKVKAYKAAMAKILNKRSQNEYDSELMQIIAPLLQRNPDISTLWNIRRECLQEKFKLLAEDVDAQQKACDDELKFTETCLVVNPKSYCGWHQRCWVLQQSPQADWAKELALCNNYLKLDERNFHTWDYRRFVIEKGGFAAEKEFDYCTERIKINFSNYSSWHQRSLLLPKLFPNKNEALPELPIDQEVMKSELDIVLTAAFTDPNDSSAWFYQRWLLSPQCNESHVCAFRCDDKKVILALSKSIPSKSSINIYDDENKICTKLTARNSECTAYANTIWIGTFENAYKIPEKDGKHYILLKIEEKSIKLELKPCENGYYYFLTPNDNLVFSDSVDEELRQQLSSCEDLLTYEPESKWTLLTTIILMRALDRRYYYNETQAHLRTLINIDCYRQGYYKDLATKWILEKKIDDWTSSEDFPKILDISEEADLAFIPYIQYLCIGDKVLLPTHLQAIYPTGLLSFGTI